MKRQRWMAAAAAIVAALALLKAVPAVAHHSAAPFYDASKRVEIQGAISKYLFKNPHSFLYVEVPDATGQKVEWQIELGASASLSRTGWTPDVLKIGTVIKANGQPSRAEGSHGMCCAKITKPDGSPIVAGGRVTEPQR
jgi:hypothetical protein